MTLLEAVDASTLRKSRRNSMIIMRAASQMNLNQGEETDKLVPNPNLLLAAAGQTSHHKEEHHQPMDGKDAMVMCVSALYGKLLVIMGMAFPIAEAISKGVHPIFYNSFYLYLYFGSIFFVIYSYFFLLHDRFIPWSLSETFKEIKMFLRPYKPNIPDFRFIEQLRTLLPQRQFSKDDSEKSEKDSVQSEDDKDLESNLSGSFNQQPTGKKSKYVFSEASHGSMYLKIGTVVFGIGSMIYSGLEFGKYFELKADCSDILMAITPVARMTFTFLQMYFIFLNSRVSISRNTIKARFGLMHMLATNLCVWVNVLVQETQHTLHHLEHEMHESHGDGHHGSGGETGHHGPEEPHHDPHHDPHHEIVSDNPLTYEEDTTEYFLNDAVATILASSPLENATEDPTQLGSVALFPKIVENLFDNSNEEESVIHNIVRRAADMSECQVFNVLGDLVNSATPFLFPCTIEYSLLCAGVIYVMWSNVITKAKIHEGRDQGSELSHMIAHKLRHHYSVDCARASRGLFLGIFVMVLTIIALIIFFVLINNKDFKNMAILQANISEIAIYSVTIVTCIIGMVQMRELSYHAHEEVELDNILLLIAQAGVFIFNSFTIIGSYFNSESGTTLALITSLFALTQATLQTLLILQGSQRTCFNNDQLDRKPGREVVTFLLVCNLAMWAISTFQTSRAQLHPTQLHFYGRWAWTIISHVSMPLAIFYRFHATVCLGEIWKKSYKMRMD